MQRSVSEKRIGRIDAPLAKQEGTLVDEPHVGKETQAGERKERRERRG